MHAIYLREYHPLAVRKKKSVTIFGPENPQPLSTEPWWQAVDSGYAEAATRTPAGCYPSTVCSSDRPALRRLVEAIDQLEADRAAADSADLEARIAAVWSMVGEIDPELARLASRYQRHAD
jgi:hypothetical protein